MTGTAIGSWEWGLTEEGGDDRAELWLNDGAERRHGDLLGGKFSAPFGVYVLFFFIERVALSLVVGVVACVGVVGIVAFVAVVIIFWVVLAVSGLDFQGRRRGECVGEFADSAFDAIRKGDRVLGANGQAAEMVSEGERYGLGDDIRIFADAGVVDIAVMLNPSQCMPGKDE